MSKKIALFILIFINCIFCLKYVARITDYGFLITLVYALLQIVIVSYAIKFFKSKFLLKSIIIAITIVPLIASIVSFIIIDPESLNVDRWSVIHSFLDELFSGNYPYYAKSHVDNPPGPMPIYFLIALPFYLFNGYSFLSLLGFVVLAVFYKKWEIQNMEWLSFLLITILSVPMLWEIFSLSNIISFGTLSAMGLWFFNKNLIRNQSSHILSSIVLGLLLSTRSVFALPYVVFFLSYLVTKVFNFKDFLKYTSIVILTFGLTFIPLIAVFKNDFFEMNPFIIQSSFLIPQEYIPLLFLIALTLGFIAKTSIERFLYSGFTLFISILIYAIYITVNYGFDSAFYGSKIDISYFLFCVPFLLFGLKETVVVTKSSLSIK